MAIPPFTIEDDNFVPPQPVPIDAALAEGAVTRIRKQVQGNGLRPSSVELRRMQGQVYDFFATTSVHFVPDVQEGKRAGRYTDGQIIQPQQIDAAIQEFIGRMAADRGVLGLVHETVLSRADHGFGLSGETIALPQVSRVFLAHEACPACRGVGGQPCHHCQGQTRITCYRCHGHGGVPCVTCSGRGQILTPHGPVTCHSCQGRGLSQCPVCQGQRMISCPECKGQGRRVCESCQGQGWTTHSWAVTLSARTSFKMRTKGLPPALVKLVERVGGARLAADHHAEVIPITGRDADANRDQTDTAEGAQLSFLYRATMPFAELDIAMGKGSIQPKLAGFKARMVDVPDFMDVLLRPGAQHLADAAQGGAGTAQMILSASRYRALGDVLRGIIRMDAKRTYKALMETYPLGLSDELARGVVKDAVTALSRLSLWPRSMVMAAGLALSFGVLATYYLYGGRAWIAATLAANGSAPAFVWLGDVLLVAALGMAGTHVIRLMAQRALRIVLEGLGVMAGGRLPLPKPGAPGMWLWAGIVIIALVFATLTGLFS